MYWAWSHPSKQATTPDWSPSHIKTTDMKRLLFLSLLAFLPVVASLKCHWVSEPNPEAAIQIGEVSSIGILSAELYGKGRWLVPYWWGIQMDMSPGGGRTLANMDNQSEVVAMCPSGAINRPKITTERNGAKQRQGSRWLSVLGQISITPICVAKEVWSQQQKVSGRYLPTAKLQARIDRNEVLSLSQVLDVVPGSPVNELFETSEFIFKSLRI